MKVAHVLRKYVPEEWGGTETAVKQLLDGLGDIESLVFAPRRRPPSSADPGPIGHPVRRYRATLPVAGIPRERRLQLESVGGNLLSFQLLSQLLREPGLDLIHTHALNRIGGAALTAARLRGRPFVATVHGGALDLPAEVADSMKAGAGLEWGKPFGALLRARKVLEQADAILTVNPREAELLRARYPRQRVLQTFHGIDLDRFATGRREAAPDFGGRPYVLVVGRIDPVKNQRWAAEQWPEVLRRHPRAVLAFAGAATDASYAGGLETFVRHRGLEDSVRLLGAFAPGAPALAGLMQNAAAVLVPSKVETFGLVAVEAWAAGAPVLASRTTGTCHLIGDGRDGLLFDLDAPATFHRALDSLLGDGGTADRLAAAGRARAQDYSIESAAAPVRALYEELIAARSKSDAA